MFQILTSPAQRVVAGTIGNYGLPPDTCFDLDEFFEPLRDAPEVKRILADMGRVIIGHSQHGRQMRGPVVGTIQWMAERAVSSNLCAVSSAVLEELAETRIHQLNHKINYLGDAPSSDRTHEFYQLSPDTAPNPTYLETKYSNLNLPETSFIGRTEAIRDVAKHLQDKRVVSIEGPAGVGKTRLAAAVADRFALQNPELTDVRVDLSASSDTTEGLINEIARVLRVDFEAQQTSARLDELLESLSYLAPVTLLLDNAERLTGEVGRLLAEFDDVDAQLNSLITTRRTMEGSYVPLEIYQLRGLSNPNALILLEDRITDNQHEQTHLTDAQIDTGLQIVDITGGYPLALELIADRSQTTPLEEIRNGLIESEDVVGSGQDIASYDRLLESTVKYMFENM